MSKYPEIVEKYILSWAEIIKESYHDMGETYPESVLYASIDKVIGKHALEEFLKNGDPTLSLTDVEAEKYMRLIYANTVIENLISLGYIDSIEDENGKEIIFITEQGKEYSKKLGIEPDNKD